jgi:predicted ATPase/DNA-binding XRE family transcriptional regulator
LSFGDWLRRRRSALGLTQAGLAQQLNCAIVTLRKFESEERRPSGDMAQSMAVCLHIPVAQHESFVRFARGELRAGDALDILDVAKVDAQLAQLPIPPYPIIGREGLIAHANDVIVKHQARVLTLIGAPGIGKTRLALELAHRLNSGFAHGAVFVELAPVRDAALVPMAIAEALRIVDNTAADTTAAVVAALHKRHMLLVLDNFEHVLDAAPFVADLVAHCSTLICLVTSRERLRIRAEHVLQVNVLAVPSAQTVTLAAAQAAPASRMFITRAEDANAQLNLTDADAPAIAELCAQLAGLPLALELLAARADLFRPAELLADLQLGLDALEDGPRDLPRRHRGLRAAIEWSLHLLSDRQRLLFSQLAVFAGGFNDEAVQAVCEQTSADLMALARASLIQTMGVERWRMLEPIRQFAEEALARDVATRHARYYFTLADLGEAELLWERPQASLALVTLERDNLRAAMRYCLKHAPELLLHWPVFPMERVWWHHGFVQEGIGWLSEIGDALRAALASSDIEEPALTRKLADILYALSDLLSWNDIERASAVGAEALALYQQLGAQQGVGWAHRQLGIMALVMHDLPAARRHIEQSLAVSRELNDQRGIYAAFGFLSEIAASRGDLPEARRLAQMGLDGFIASGDPEGISLCQQLLGTIALLGHDWAAARGCFEASRPLAAQHGFKTDESQALWALALIQTKMGHADDAIRLLRDSLAINEAVHYAWGRMLCYQLFADIALSLVEHPIAAWFWAVAQKLEASARPIYAAHDLVVRDVRQSLRDAFASGDASTPPGMTFDEALTALEHAV